MSQRGRVWSKDGLRLVGDGGRVPASHWQSQWHTERATLYTSDTATRRFIGSIRRECLDHFLFFGLQHLTSVAAVHLVYYLAERPHQGLGNELLPETRKPKADNAEKNPVALPIRSLRDVRCDQRLGGLLKHYSRKAA